MQCLEMWIMQYILKVLILAFNVLLMWVCNVHVYILYQTMQCVANKGMQCSQIYVFFTRLCIVLLMWVCNRVGNLLIGFSSNSLVFCEQKSNSLFKKRELLLSLFCKERRERIAHGCSFVMSDLSKSLTVALL